MKSERSSNDSRRLRNFIALFVRCGVAVGVCNKGETRIRGVVAFRGAHELGAGDIDDFAVLVVFGGVAEGEEDAATGPGKLVTCWWVLVSALEWYGESKSTERVITGFWSWEAAAVAEETCDLAAGLVDFGDGFHRLRVVSLTGLEIGIARLCDIRIGGQCPDLDCWRSQGQHRFPKNISSVQNIFLEYLLLEHREAQKRHKKLRVTNPTSLRTVMPASLASVLMVSRCTQQKLNWYMKVA